MLVVLNGGNDIHDALVTAKDDAVAPGILSKVQNIGVSGANDASPVLTSVAVSIVESTQGAVRRRPVYAVQV